MTAIWRLLPKSRVDHRLGADPDRYGRLLRRADDHGRGGDQQSWCPWGGHSALVTGTDRGRLLRGGRQPSVGARTPVAEPDWAAASMWPHVPLLTITRGCSFGACPNAQLAVPRSP